MKLESESLHTTQNTYTKTNPCSTGPSPVREDARRLPGTAAPAAGADRASGIWFGASARVSAFTDGILDEERVAIRSELARFDNAGGSDTLACG